MANERDDTERRNERFEAAYTQHARRILHFCFARTGSYADAEDLTGEVFARFLRDEHRIAEESTAAWLFKVARRACIDRARTSHTHEPLTSAENVAAPSRADRLEDADVWSALGSLAPAAQQVVYLRAIEDLPFKEVACLLGMSQAAVKMRYGRAVRKLGTLLEEREKDDAAGEAQFDAALQ